MCVFYRCSGRCGGTRTREHPCRRASRRPRRMRPLRSPPCALAPRCGADGAFAKCDHRGRGSRSKSAPRAQRFDDDISAGGPMRSKLSATAPRCAASVHTGSRATAGALYVSYVVKLTPLGADQLTDRPDRSPIRPPAALQQDVFTPGPRPAGSPPGRGDGLADSTSAHVNSRTPRSLCDGTVRHRAGATGSGTYLPISTTTQPGVKPSMLALRDSLAALAWLPFGGHRPGEEPSGHRARAGAVVSQGRRSVASDRVYRWLPHRTSTIRVGGLTPCFGPSQLSCSDCGC